MPTLCCNKRQEQDLKFGFRMEKEVLPIFNKKFKCEATISEDEFSTFDYLCRKKKIFGELKSRRVSKNQYSSTMIGYNKISKGFDMILKGYRVIFLWCFTDELCYYELKKETFRDCFVKWNQLTRWDRGREERSNMAYIPVELLKPIIKVS